MGPHLGVARTYGREAHMSKARHRRGAGAEEGAGATGGSSDEVAVVERLCGTVEPLELG